MERIITPKTSFWSFRTNYHMTVLEEIPLQAEEYTRSTWEIDMIVTTYKMDS